MERGLWSSPAASAAAGTPYSDYKRAPSPSTAAVRGCRWVYTYVPPGCKSYEWNLIAEVDNDASEGDVCASYIKARKWGRGATWPAVFEAQDMYEGADGGPLHAVEIDYMGPRGRRTTGAGVLCVFGRSALGPLRDPDDNGVSHLDTYFRLVPYYWDFGKTKIDYFIRAEVKCEKAIISMQGGDCIQFSDDPAVPVHRFDPQTGYVGYWKGRLCVWGVHAVNGDVVKMRTFA